MKNTYLFIEHVVNNWSTTLKEAFAPAVKQQLLDKFKQEADDLNQQISDEQSMNVGCILNKKIVY